MKDFTSDLASGPGLHMNHIDRVKGRIVGGSLQTVSKDLAHLGSDDLELARRANLFDAFANVFPTENAIFKNFLVRVRGEQGKRGIHEVSTNCVHFIISGL